MDHREKWQNWKGIKGINSPVQNNKKHKTRKKKKKRDEQIGSFKIPFFFPLLLAESDSGETKNDATQKKFKENFESEMKRRKELNSTHSLCVQCVLWVSSLTRSSTEEKMDCVSEQESRSNNNERNL